MYSITPVSLAKNKGRQTGSSNPLGQERAPGNPPLTRPITLAWWSEACAG